jgi:hypothetical protein
MMGLVGATPGLTLSVKVTVYGKDTTGANISHQFVFNDAWSDPGPVPRTDINQYSFKVDLDHLFASIDNIVVDERANDGPGSAIMIWNMLTPYTNFSGMKDVCHIASVLWDGYRFARVYDRRIVATTVRDFLTESVATPSNDFYTHVLAGGNATVYIDDFRQPKYHNLDKQYDGTAGRPYGEFHKLQPGTYGTYETIAFPVDPLSGTKWRVTLLGNKLSRGASGAFPDVISFKVFDGAAWTYNTASVVPGVPNTYEVNLAAVPVRIAVLAYFTQSTGMILYG